MAFGISKKELADWKNRAASGKVALITHYWYDPRYPEFHTVTKAACADHDKLLAWGKQFGFQPHWIHYREEYSHFDIRGPKQIEVLEACGHSEAITRFRLSSSKV